VLTNISDVAQKVGQIDSLNSRSTLQSTGQLAGRLTGPSTGQSAVKSAGQPLTRQQCHQARLPVERVETVSSDTYLARMLPCKCAFKLAADMTWRWLGKIEKEQDADHHRTIVPTIQDPAELNSSAWSRWMTGKKETSHSEAQLIHEIALQLHNLQYYNYRLYFPNFWIHTVFKILNDNVK